MKATVWDPTTGQRLGVARLGKEAHVEDFHAGTAHGVPVIRSATYPQRADDTRRRWAALQRFVADTGFGLVIQTNRREADALMGSYVATNGGTYRLTLSEDRRRVVVRYGHGSVR